MELNRLVRVIRDRWRVIVLVATIGFVTAFGFTTLTNRDLDDSWEALIALRFDPGEGQSVDDLADAINDTRGLAVLAAEDLLEQDPTSAIFADTAAGRLFFRAEADTQAVAIERANELLRAYLNSLAGGGDADARLLELARQAEELTLERDLLEPSLDEDQLLLASRHQILDLSIAAIRDRIVALTVADAAASSEQAAINAAERGNLNETLTELITEKASLPPAPLTSLSVADQLRFDALQRQIDVIGLEYQQLSLGARGLLDENTQQEPVRINNLAPVPARPLANAIIGLIGGTALAVFALIFVTRSRKEVWLPEDLPVPLLGEIPHRKVTTLPGPSWYDATVGGRRKEAIQAARTAIDGSLGHESVAVAIVGDRVGATATHAVAVDLAASFASAGRTVLLVGADFQSQVDMTEYQVGEPSLSTLLRKPAGPKEDLDMAIGRMIEDIVQIRTDLYVLPPGPSPDSPADALAGQHFRRFVELAREQFDLVIAVAGDSDAASSHVLTQRLGAAIVAIAPGKTTIPRIDGLMVDMSQQRVQLPGVVMIYGNDSRIAIPSRRKQAAPPAYVASSEPATSRLRFYPFPGSKRSVTPTDGSLDHLAAGLSRSNANATDSGEDTKVSANGHADGERLVPPVDPASTVGEQLLSALEGMDRTKTQGPVAEYVVARVEDMMTAVPGQANVSVEMVDVATDLAFVPLTPVKNVPTVWQRLVAELETEVGVMLGKRLASAISDALTEVQDVESHAVDIWLTQEFFQRHLARTDNEPDVWHLSSPGGAVQALVNGRRLTDARLGRFTTDVVRRRIHELEGELKSLRLAGESNAAQTTEDDLKDAHLLEVTLGVLRGGTSQEAKIIYPWRRPDQMPKGWNPVWSEGVRPNIAPLQKLGLLPFDVLTEEELLEFAAPR